MDRRYVVELTDLKAMGIPEHSDLALLLRYTHAFATFLHAPKLLSRRGVVQAR